METGEHVPRHRFTDLNQLSVSLRLGSYTGEILNWGFLGNRWWRNYLHVHSFYEVCCAFEGEGVFRINDVESAVCAGDVFVAKPSEPHEIVSSHDSPLGIYFWSYTLVSNGRQDREACELDALLRAFVESRRWVSHHVAPMSHTLELLTDEIVARAPGYRLNIEHLTAKLLIDTARSVCPLESLPKEMAERSDRRDPAALLVQRIERYLRDNFSRPICVRDVAAQVHLSERHTCRLYHQATGASIKERLTAFRIEAASQLLLSGRLPIKEVGEASGFPDVQHFTTVFRLHTGLTPTAFRNRGGTNFINPANPGHVEATLETADVRFAK